MSPEEAIATDQATSIGSGVILIDKALRAYGVDPQALFTKAGIDLEEASLPGARVSSAKVYELHRLGIAATGDACFGLKVARQRKPLRQLVCRPSLPP